MTPTEVAVLRVFIDNAGRIVGRATLQRSAGLQHCTERRCDGVVSNLRRMLGDTAIITVRSRGWMLNSVAIPAAQALLATPDATV
ncbi:MAG: winged helix-turn-helix domain-containing protein [Actinobacteria bacterium]|nr:winged helix-turn-helix domain-containing protein [Actinomycetota bacterium]